MGKGIFSSLVTGLRRFWKGTGNKEKTEHLPAENESRPLLLTPDLRVEEHSSTPKQHLDSYPESPSTPSAKTEKPPRKKRKKIRQTHTDKNEIPILTDEHDLYRLFDTADGNQKKSGRNITNGKKSQKRNLHRERKAEDFEQLFEESKTDRFHTQMLEEKKDACKKEDTATIRFWELFSEYPPPQAELDLHGYTASQAESGTERFIRNCRERGYMSIRLITGKGTHSQGKAILPDVVEKKVVSLKRKKRWILGYQWEKKDKRKSGSLVVYLIPTQMK